MNFNQPSTSNNNNNDINGSSATVNQNGLFPPTPTSSPLLSLNHQQQQQQQQQGGFGFPSQTFSGFTLTASSHDAAAGTTAPSLAASPLFPSGVASNSSASSTASHPSGIPQSPLIPSQTSSNHHQDKIRTSGYHATSSASPGPSAAMANGHHQPSLLEESAAYLNESVNSPRKPHRLSIKEKNSEEGRRKRNESMNQIRKNKRDENASSKRMYPSSSSADGAESMDVNSIEKKATLNQNQPSAFKLSSSISNPMFNASSPMSIATTSMLHHNPQAQFSKDAFFHPESFASDRVKQPDVLAERLRSYPRPDPMLAMKFENYLQSNPALPLSIQSIPVIMEVFTNPFSAPDQVLVLMIQCLRKLISVPQASPVDFAISVGSLFHLCNFLEHPNPKIQYEACWCLTNIASSPRTNTVVEAGAIPLVGQLMFSSDAEIREQCAWCLGNIMGDCTEYRDAVMNQVPFALRMLCDQVSDPATLAMQRTAAWAISNFTRGRPPPPAEAVWFAIPILVRLLQTCNDDPTRLDAYWGICYFSDVSGTPIVPPASSYKMIGETPMPKAEALPVPIDPHIGERKIQYLIELGLCSTIVSTLNTSNGMAVKQVTPALKISGNITSSKNPAHTEALIQAGIGNVIPILLAHPLTNTKKEACWMFSNICAGTADQIRAVLNQNLHILEKLFNCVEREPYEIRREALWCFLNMVQNGYADDVNKIVLQCTLLRIFARELGDSTTAPNVIIHIFKSCERLLQIDLDRYVHEFDEHGLITAIEVLQSHINQEVFVESARLIRTYFGEEEESMDALQPSVSDSTGMFAFTPDIQGGFANNSFSMASPFTSSTSAPGFSGLTVSQFTSQANNTSQQASLNSNNNNTGVDQSDPNKSLPSMQLY